VIARPQEPLDLHARLGGDRADSDASRGSGLTGLRDRVEAVGGIMTVDSPAGVGIVLTVLLPVTADGH
jgi:signal transduction histidine kinase